MARAFLNQDHKLDYRAWIAAHPRGFCVEIRRASLPPVLHRVGCVCLGVDGVDWVPIPVHCFVDESDVNAWFQESDGFGLSDEYVLSLEECALCG